MYAMKINSHLVKQKFSGDGKIIDFYKCQIWLVFVVNLNKLN